MGKGIPALRYKEAVMARETTKTAVPRNPRVQPSGFDVTCVIGSVRFGDGELSPYQAAFALIAKHGATGVFTFPSEGGGEITVEVNDSSIPREEDDDWVHRADRTDSVN